MDDMAGLALLRAYAASAVVSSPDCLAKSGDETTSAGCMGMGRAQRARERDGAWVG